MNVRALLTALCLLVGCGLAQAAVQTPPHMSDAQARTGDAAILLREAAQRSRGLRQLVAEFTQEKKLSILAQPLASSGYMCMKRNADAPAADGGDGASGADQVLWVYEKPTPSGFMQEGGTAWLWTGEQARRRRAQGAEAAALKAITTQIMAWVRIQPEELERLYSMERLPDTPDAAGSAPVLRLVPRQFGAFFAALEVTLAPDLRTMRQLRFEERNGDTTLLRFADVLTSEQDIPLPPRCQAPQPAP